jgi:DNA invertase Pin-like site-specific DNA recombinase
MCDIGLHLLKVAKEKDICVYALKGNWSLNSTIESKIMATMLALISEIERDFIVSRTKEALAARKAQGIKLGRPKGPGKSKLDKYRPEIEAMLKNGSTKTYIARRYKTTPANLFNWLKKNKINIKPSYNVE